MALDNMIANSYYNRGTHGQSGFHSPKDGNYMVIFPKKRKKNNSPEYKTQAINTLGDYKHWGLLSNEEHKDLKRKIEDAEADDDVSLIMNKVRRKVYAKYE